MQRLFGSRSRWPSDLRHVGLRLLTCRNCRFDSRQGHGCLFLVSVMCCQVKVSAKGRSPVQRNPAECDVSECYAETSTRERPCPLGISSHKKIFISRKNAIWWHTNVTKNRKLYIYRNTIHGILVYGAEVWQIPTSRNK